MIDPPEFGLLLDGVFLDYSLNLMAWAIKISCF